MGEVGARLIPPPADDDEKDELVCRPVEQLNPLAASQHVLDLVGELGGLEEQRQHRLLVLQRQP